MDISTKFSDKKRNLSDQYNNSKTGNKCTHRLGNPKQKKQPRPIIVKFVWHNFNGGSF